MCVCVPCVMSSVTKNQNRLVSPLGFIHTISTEEGGEAVRSSREARAGMRNRKMQSTLSEPIPSQGLEIYIYIVRKEVTDVRTNLFF